MRVYGKFEGMGGTARDDRLDFDCDAREAFEYVDMRLFANEGGRCPVVLRVGVEFVISGGKEARLEFGGEEVEDGDDVGGDVILLAMMKKRVWYGKICSLASGVADRKGFALMV